MPTFTLDRIVQSTGGTVHRTAEGQALAVSTDSRRLKPGALFVALRGPRHDAHRYLAEVFRKGAWGALVAESALETDEVRRQLSSTATGAVIGVADTERGLGDLAKAHRAGLDLRVAGITGSNGKTTTKEMTAAIVGRRYRVLKNRGNYNNLIGLPLTVLELEEHHEAAVLEMGMNRRGEIDRLAEIARPTVGVVTNIGPVHLEHLGTIAAVLEAKAELLERLDSSATAVLNADDPSTAALRPRVPGRCLTFGLGPADYRATGVRLAASGTSFTLHCPEGVTEITTPVLGKHNVRNALAAAAAAAALGAGLDQVREGLAASEPVDMRFTVEDFDRGIRFVNDAYNANPASMGAALDSLALIKGASRRAAVLGDMLELGRLSEKAHRTLGEEAARSGLDLLVAVGGFSRAVALGAADAGLAEDRIHTARDAAEAARFLGRWLREGDLVLLKGSRGVGLERVVRTLRDTGVLQRAEE